MEDVGKLLAAPSFWYVQAILAIVLGVVSTYLKEWIDRLASSLSARWRKRSEALRVARRAHVDFLREHPDSRPEFRAMEARLRLKGIHDIGRGCFLLLALLFLWSAFGYDLKPVSTGLRYTLNGLSIAATVLIFMAMGSATKNFSRANDYELQLREAGTA